ncbi:DUF1330 domain-containing protein [Emcibacter nanhaiensis]|uniref:DUF1330 domain-containing protein n=1 Tax=Emcibacter nanhaiensis TaxID=1505037 RepID=A0A501PRI5_9PROT|nr:DUF1330 domain-containing protein [Emcibacter nanhaiensis]TPD63140.1 DUF1330 domain-containing protein [Emcibacter nanhaiensis]
MYVFPTDKQIEEFTARDPDLPMLMVNLVRFRENAFYPDGSRFTPCSGQTAFEERYAGPASQIAEAMGARLVIGEAVRQIFVGPEDEKWHRFYLLYYPETRIFLDLLVMPEFLDLSVHRTAGSLDARMIICDGPDVPNGLIKDFRP